MNQPYPTSSAPAGALVSPPGAAASMVCGILSIVFCWVPVVGLVLGIIALVLSSKAKGHVVRNPGMYTPGGMRTAGFVCGIIGTVFSALYLVWWLAFAAFITSDEGRRTFEEIQRQLEEQRQNQGR
jgi:hypothetical protein